MEKKIIQIRNRWTNSIIFEYEKEGNTTRDTVIQAIRKGIDLGEANLSGAKLYDVDFSNVNLRGADLYGADLKGCFFTKACLVSVIFRKANLNKARFDGADLLNADLTDAFLVEAMLDEAKNVPYYPLACPSEGAFIGWKKVVTDDGIAYLIKLEIPQDARRCSAGSRKCRCDKAKVLGITRLDAPSKTIRGVVNFAYGQTVYKVNQMVFPDSFDDNRWAECSHGIHFFINKKDAENYFI